jgi:hypothetical protein
MEAVGPIFRDRWLAPMRREAAQFRQDFPVLLDRVAAEAGASAVWAGRQLCEALVALECILPSEDFWSERVALQALMAPAYSS